MYNEKKIKGGCNIFFLLVIVCHYCNCIAQAKVADSSIDSIRLSSKAYYKLNKKSLRDSIYRFPSFQYGRVTFATGFSPEEKLRFNYNLYLGQMDLITNDGDTTQIQRSKDLKLVSVGEHLFFHDNRLGYLEIVYQSPIVLSVLSRLSTVDWVSASESDRYYTKEKHYYFLDQENKSYLASPTSIQKLFNDQRKKIKDYLAENKIDFENQDNLIKLLKFCNELGGENQN
jgi:hypothetical protein